MFLTKRGMLEDYEFIDKLASTIFKQYGLKGLESNVSSLEPSGNYDDHSTNILDLLLQKLIERSIESGALETYINKSIEGLKNSPKKDEILQELSVLLEEHRIETKKKSEVPWVEIEGDYYDEEQKRMKIKFDWNDAFIQLLKKKGYPGESEDDMVQMWLQEIARQR